MLTINGKDISDLLGGVVVKKEVRKGVVVYLATYPHRPSGLIERFFDKFGETDLSVRFLETRMIYGTPKSYIGIVIKQN